MNKFLSLSLLGATLALISAVAQLHRFETEPVTLNTDKGDVCLPALQPQQPFCFDHVIAMPHAMHVA